MINLDAHEVPLEDRDVTSNAPCETNPYLRASTTLLSRLAEAVDGHRYGRRVCYVGRFWYEPGKQGHRLYGPFRDCTEAEEFRESLPDKDEYGLFGPYYTKKQPLRAADTREVAKVVVHFTGTADTITLDGEEFDAVFWSASSLEKFLIPYYVSIGTLTEGNVLADVAENFEVLGHRPGSIWQTESKSLDHLGQPLGVGLYGLSPDGGGAAPFKARLVSGGDDR
ncbi:MAG TPA: hypothetical protein VEQ60_04535 [Longimicrobium sp.]|nr:hypothetical protein [Longimicrobium sp.]